MPNPKNSSNKARLSRLVCTVLGAASAIAAPAYAAAAVRTVVLVHGAFADGSGWKPVADILRRDGYRVLVVREPETTLADDVAATKRALDQAGPCVLVGHSYGGVIITEAGVHDAARALVYVAAFQPDVGESAGALSGKTPAASTAIVPIGGGFLQVDPAQFSADFAGDVPKQTADYMAISQVPITAEAFGAPVSVAAWKTKPSYAVVASNDRMINPLLERSMYARSRATTIELPASHAVYISHAEPVARLIEKAAQAAD